MRVLLLLLLYLWNATR